MTDYLTVVDNETRERTNTTKAASAAALVANLDDALVTDGIVGYSWKITDGAWEPVAVIEQLFPTDPHHWVCRITDILNLFSKPEVIND